MRLGAFSAWYAAHNKSLSSGVEDSEFISASDTSGLINLCLDAIRAAEGRVPVRNPGKTVVPAPPSAPSPHTAPVPVPPAGPPGQPRVSVVIPCHNLGHYLDETVDSVLCQTLQDFEIIIVDDGSTDGTREFLSSLKNSLVKVFFHEHNMGKTAGINTGLKYFTGDIVIFQDADLEYPPLKNFNNKILKSKLSLLGLKMCLAIGWAIKSAI